MQQRMPRPLSERVLKRCAVSGGSNAFAEGIVAIQIASFPFFRFNGGNTVIVVVIGRVASVSHVHTSDA